MAIDKQAMTDASTDDKLKEAGFLTAKKLQAIYNDYVFDHADWYDTELKSFEDDSGVEANEIDIEPVMFGSLLKTDIRFLNSRIINEEVSSGEF